MMRLIGLAAAAALALAAPAAAQQFPTGLHGIKIAVADYERATRFYEILGMKPGTKYNTKEWELRWADPAKGSVVIMVNDPSGGIHIEKGGAFMMVSVADVPATAARLKAAGFAVPSQPISTPQATILMLKDPDGNGIELLGPPAVEPDHDHAH